MPLITILDPRYCATASSLLGPGARRDPAAALAAMPTLEVFAGPLNFPPTGRVHVIAVPERPPYTRAQGAPGCGRACVMLAMPPVQRNGQARFLVFTEHGQVDLVLTTLEVRPPSRLRDMRAGDIIEFIYEHDFLSPSEWSHASAPSDASRATASADRLAARYAERDQRALDAQAADLARAIDADIVRRFTEHPSPSTNGTAPDAYTEVWTFDGQSVTSRRINDSGGGTVREVTWTSAYPARGPEGQGREPYSSHPEANVAPRAGRGRDGGGGRGQLGRPPGPRQRLPG